MVPANISRYFGYNRQVFTDIPLMGVRKGIMTDVVYISLTVHGMAMM